MKTLDARHVDTEVILDSLNDGVVTIGLDKKIKYLNKAAERLLGLFQGRSQRDVLRTGGSVRRLRP